MTDATTTTKHHTTAVGTRLGRAELGTGIGCHTPGADHAGLPGAVQLYWSEGGDGGCH